MPKKPKKTYLISACLLGLATRYDGGHSCSPRLRRFCRRYRLIPVCPEQLGGLPTPRYPAEIRGGDGSAVLQGKAVVVDKTGADRTTQFICGAIGALQLADLFQVDGAILKSGSPSCGVGSIRDGSFSGCHRSGDGVAAALLKGHGIPVYSELKLPPEIISRRQSSLKKRRSPG